MKVGVIFGSRAAEHDVSIISGLQLIENADKSKYDIFPIYISRSGDWFVGDPLRSIKTYSNFDSNMKGITKVVLPATPNMKGLYSLSLSMLGKSRKVCDLDCAILALHGMHGEDGTVQGLLELADIPYTSCSVVGSAVGMDKIVMKSVFKSLGLSTAKSVFCYRSEWKSKKNDVIMRAESLKYPLYVKPANLGSSIGIGKAVDRNSLIKAIDTASYYDRRILIEQEINNPVEINCACLGFDGEAIPSLCEQPASWEEFLSFDDKYMRGGGKGMEGLMRKVPAPISAELTERIRSCTVEIFRVLECKGVVRIDYMIDRDTNEIYVCEINTIPGSFAFYLYEPMGISYKQLIDKLIEYAIKAIEQKKESSYAFDSEILTKAQFSTKNSGKLSSNK